MRKKQINANYLDNKPERKEGIRWSKDDEGMVTLEIENKGLMNRVAQKLFKKPPISYIHLDEMGSFIWPLLDGERDITSLGEDVEKRFGETAHPLYERLAKYIQILESYGFVTLNKE